MEIVFLGVGEACDPENFNTSILLKKCGKNKIDILLDCGFTAAHRYWAVNSQSDDLTALWISHFHGDHFMGTPLLLLRFYELGRTLPFTIIGPLGVEDKVLSAVNLAYPNMLEKLNFHLSFIELPAGKIITECGVQWQSAPCEHSQNAHGLRLADAKTSIFYSGDGRPTADTQKLAMGCDLVIHEAFSFQNNISGHGKVEQAIEFARGAQAPHLALVHIDRAERKRHHQDILQLIEQEKGLDILLPEPGDVLHLN